MKRNTTELDVELATLFYPLLIDLARRDELTTYNGLKGLARQQYPDHALTIDRCADQSVGRRLDVVRQFTEEKDYPDVTALVVNKASGTVGSGFVGNAEAERELIRSFPWETVETEFRVHVCDLKKSLVQHAIKAKGLSQADAQKLMIAAAQTGNHRRPTNKERDTIIASIRQGTAAHEALELLRVAGGQVAPNPST